MITIEKLIRINQDPIFISYSDREKTGFTYEKSIIAERDPSRSVLLP